MNTILKYFAGPAFIGVAMVLAFASGRCGGGSCSVCYGYSSKCLSDNGKRAD